MQTREQVIEGLNGIHAVACGMGDDACYLNSIGIRRLQTLINDATALLEADATRVLTLEEVMARRGEPAYMETKSARGYKGYVLIYDVQEGMGITGVRIGVTKPGHITTWPSKDLYGVRWRCWTAKPTEAQMKAEAWSA